MVNYVPKICEWKWVKLSKKDQIIWLKKRKKKEIYAKRQMHQKIEKIYNKLLKKSLQMED